MNILSVDPGKKSGVVLYNGTDFSNVQVLNMGDVAPTIHVLLGREEVDVLLVEGWQTMPGRLDSSTVYPNENIGVCKGLAYAHNTRFRTVFASVWKRQLKKNAEILPNIPGIQSNCQSLAKAVSARLGAFPYHLFDDIPQELRTHALDAVGLALWGSYNLPERTR